MKLRAGIRRVGGCIVALAASVCQMANAACPVSDHTVVIHVKRLKKDITFEIPARYPLRIFDHRFFIISFSYPSFAPRPIDAGILEPAARLVVTGEAVDAAWADFMLKRPPAIYQRTEKGIDIYQGHFKTGGPIDEYYFRDSGGNPVLFKDIGSFTVGYEYYRKLPSGLDVKGIISKKVGSSFRTVDADITNFFENMICKKD